MTSRKIKFGKFYFFARMRDYRFRNYSALHTLKMWSSVNKGEQKYIFPYQEEADCMFNSSILYDNDFDKNSLIF